MEYDESLGTVVRDAGPESDSKPKESVSTTKKPEATPFANRQNADDDSPMVANPQQAPQGHLTPVGPSDTKSKHHTARDRGEDDVPAMSGPIGNDESSSLYLSDSEDEVSGDTLLWCTVTQRNHGELVEWSLHKCPACGQKVNKPRPQPVPQAPKTHWQGAVTAASADSTAHQQAQLGYSNKFLWKNGEEIFSEHWPDLLDLDRDRGNLAMAQRPTNEPVLEIVTIVATNLTQNTRVRRDTTWVMSDSSVSIECIGKEVIVHSRRVLDVLQTVVTYYPKLDLAGMSLRISQPYALFYHHFEEIKDFQSTHHQPHENQPKPEHPKTASTPGHLKLCDEETYKHLKIVQEVIERENFVEVQEETDRHKQTPAVATYSMLWLLFKPGTKIYVRRLGSPAHAGVVLSLQGGDLSPGKSEPFSIDYWTLNFDGNRLGRNPLDFVFKPFTGEKRISELEVSPCSYYDAEDGGVLRETLINRGQKFWRFLPGCQVDYMGKLPKDQSEWQGRVIIDPMTHFRYAYSDRDYHSIFRGIKLAPVTVGNIQDSGSQVQTPQPPMHPMGPMGMPPMGMQPAPLAPGWSNEPIVPTGPSQRWQFNGPPRNENGPWAEYDNIIPGPDNQGLELIDKVTGETDMSRYLMCPPHVVGFDLKARQWETFDIACCHEVVFNHSAIDSLVMKEERKWVIKSLVHRYTAADTSADGTPAPKPWTADFIKNKGEGQIFLLHGSPGVGKTYTSECIAEATRRPLLSLTCGDIGTNEVMAERTLSRWFRLAEIWGAVMLLDEADVFLEKRSISDLQRNSLVSVFLRIVEYYRGILFLTTNRVGQFDDAFVSRIHTVIHYENFSKHEQDRIWAQFFTKLEKERWRDIRIDYSATNYVSKSEDLQKIEWNGRQIRNAFQTAVAFAEYRFLQMSPEEKVERGKASLEDQDFAKVCEMTNAFQGYMTSVHGGDESRRARNERIRDDKFKDGSSSF